MPSFHFSVAGAAEDVTELVGAFGKFVRDHGHHGITYADVASAQFAGDPRDIPALDADPNAPLEATPAVAEPEDAAPATDDTRDSDVSRETAAPGPPRVYSGVADTRDDLPVTVVSDGTETAGNVDITSPDGLSTSTAARPPVTLDPHDPGPVPEKP